MKQKLTGFTLIELIIVISVIAIIAGISIPFYINLREEAIDKNVIGLSSAYHSAVVTAHAAYQVGKSLPYPMTSDGWPGASSMNASTCTTLWTELLENAPTATTSFSIGSNNYYVFGTGAYCYYLNMQSTSPLRYFIYNSSDGNVTVIGAS
ncbi:MAG: prepilin-type N-terminal cleavage/methylation domain-containing protein [Gammaproteobacteria bacterium]